MTKKHKAKQKAQEEKRQRSEMLKDEAAEQINRQFRDGTLWHNTKKKRK